MICNQKLLLSLLIIIFTSSLTVCQAQTQKGGLEYNADRFNYSALNVKGLTSEGDAYFNKALQEKRKYYRNNAFDAAMAKYYLVIKAEPKNSYVLTQTARIYSFKNQDKLALEYFTRALNLQPHSPLVNYYFGEFYYKKRDFNRALQFYLRAEKSPDGSFGQTYNLNYRLGTVYEKLAELQKAKLYYEAAFKLNPQNSVLQSKIKDIDRLDYGKSGYYQGVK